jgi:hypothetical protein
MCPCPRGILGERQRKKTGEEGYIDIVLEQLHDEKGYTDSDGNTWYGIEYFCVKRIEKLLENYRALLKKQSGYIPSHPIEPWWDKIHPTLECISKIDWPWDTRKKRDDAPSKRSLPIDSPCSECKYIETLKQDVRIMGEMMVSFENMLRRLSGKQMPSKPFDNKRTPDVLDQTLSDEFKDFEQKYPFLSIQINKLIMESIGAGETSFKIEDRWGITPGAGTSSKNLVK